MSDSTDVLIVGTGHGGAQTAMALRKRGFAGTITMVGQEPDLPYSRPSLSKEYLSGEKTVGQIQTKPATFWQEQDVTIRTGTRVVAIDPAAHVVRFEDGGSIGYGTMVWAAGGHARRLGCAGNDLAGVHTVRSRADVDRLLQELGSVTRIVVVGGGYVGLEAAAVLSGSGKQVTVLEAQDRVLARIAGTALSRVVEAEHRAQGVDVRLGVTVDCIEGDGQKVTGVRLADGTVVPAEMVIVGVGIVPAVEPLLSAGARGGNGVAVDDHARTSLPDIFAIGDCAEYASTFAGGLPVRLESVQNANGMALTVAKAITGQPEPYRAVPWFWSNQYDLVLQTVGLSHGYDQEVERGDPAGGNFSIIYLKQGRVIALDCVNAAEDYKQGRALVQSGATVAPDILADTGTPLAEMGTVALVAAG